MDIEEKYENSVKGYRTAKSAQATGGFYLEAYYYGFEPTGNSLIDEILQAVAIAGKGYHHTEDWNNFEEGRLTPSDVIQHAANKAAAALT